MLAHDYRDAFSGQSARKSPRRTLARTTRWLGAGRNGVEEGGEGGDQVIDAHADIASGRDALDSICGELLTRTFTRLVTWG